MATHTILMSSDVRLAAAQLVEYYGLRFQIEFNFRDAQQHFGLEDFMNVTPTFGYCLMSVSTVSVVYHTHLTYLLLVFVVSVQVVSCQNYHLI